MRFTVCSSLTGIMASHTPKKTIKGKYQKRGVITNFPEKWDRAAVINHRDMFLTEVNGMMLVGVAALVVTKRTNLRDSQSRTVLLRSVAPI
jgi:hypothetical protein